MSANSFDSRATLKAGGKSYEIYRLDSLERRGLSVARLPYSLKILLENLLRREDGRVVRAEDIEKLARWDARKVPDEEIAFMRARVLLQDFTGVPAVVDLAAMRDAIVQMGGDPKRVNPQLPAELVIDHSVIVDEFGTPTAFQVNADLEFQRNRERYALLRWAQRTFQGFRVVPPDTGIVHQVNLEYLARVVFTTGGRAPQAYPDTLVGTDSHTTMINGLGVLGWGVGGEGGRLVGGNRRGRVFFPRGAGVEPVYPDPLSLALSTVEPSLAGPRRPQDRVSLRDLPRNFQLALPALVKPSSPIAPAVNSGRWEAEGGHVATAVETPPRHRTHVDLQLDGVDCKLRHGSVVIAAITSCTNTSNPSVMIAAGLVAKKAVEKGLESQPWVKTSLAPGSKVVTDYLQQAGLMRHLEQLRFQLVGYGRTTCLGNSGPLPVAASAAITDGQPV